MPHEKGATTRTLAISDFSIAHGQEIFFDTFALKKCWCNLKKDTLKIVIGYYSESVEMPVFIVSGDKYSSYALFTSDISEFNGKMSMKIPTNSDKLILNKSKVVIGDTLLGQFGLLSDTIKFRGWNRPILFKGRFQCIIEGD